MSKTLSQCSNWWVNTAEAPEGCVKLQLLPGLDLGCQWRNKFSQIHLLSSVRFGFSALKIQKGGTKMKHN